VSSCLIVGRCSAFDGYLPSWFFGGLVHTQGERQMGNFVTAVIAACAAIAGGMLTSLFALKMQREARNAEERRWALEATERRLERFQGERLSAYTEFLAEASNAFGYQSAQMVERCKGFDQSARVVSAGVLHLQRFEHPDFNKDAPRRMLRRHSTVMMVAESAHVRAAADGIVKAFFKQVAIDDRAVDLNEQFFAIAAEWGKLHSEFSDAARAELLKDIQ
jgi:hypothetical protein